MSHNLTASSLFITGAARFNYLVYLTIQDRKLVDREVEHSRFIAFQRGELAHMGDRNWTTAAMCVAKQPADKLIVIGTDGDVFTYVKGTAVDEVIEPRPVALRGVGIVDGYPIACGMKRQVFRRSGENLWTEMHAPPPGANENAGFEDVCGFSWNEIYAAGWNGEIWYWDGLKWINCASPTNLILTGLCCGGDESVYACGQHGTLVKGRQNEWELVDLNNVVDDFWDVCWFKGKLYIATMTMLFSRSDNQIMPVDFGADVPRTCYRLTQADGVLWSIGSADVFSFNGEEWKRAD